MPSHLTTSGGLLSGHFLEALRQPVQAHAGVRPESFALPGQPAPRPAELEDATATAYELLVEQWDAIHADIRGMDVGAMRRRWLLPLLSLLDFEPVYQRGDTVLNEGGRDELRFDLSYRGWAEGDMAGCSPPVIHSVTPAQGLDAKTNGHGRGPKARSPHDMVQLFLNVSPGERWAVVSNGLELRLLRDYHHTSMRGYVGFDLEGLFETRDFGDFRALYRLCHASRFLPATPAADANAAEPAPILLERLYQDSQAAGVRVGDDLRGQVRDAIELLANGFLDGPALPRLQADARLTARFYRELLHVVYRVLFLLYAEQRGLLPRPDAPLADLFRQSYSITALRERALNAAIPEADPHSDLWEGLRVSFAMVAQGAAELGVYAFDGMLFDPAQTPILAELSCRNPALLAALRALTAVTREGSLQRISYADLGVEELGSVYESLLDFRPRISDAPEQVEGRDIPAHTFFLDPRGAERKTTGSHYTPAALVNELIHSALLPVLRQRLQAAGLPVRPQHEAATAGAGALADYESLTPAQRQAGEAAILGLTVCDSAMGSGHFLAAANNALGLELARLRGGDAYPAQAVVQAARRDVLTHCIYGVDLNPMAVELARVSLWINAAAADRPLSFLDHHLKCGNSLLGATPALLAAGIPDAAFQPVSGDDAAIAMAARKRNAGELRLRQAEVQQPNLWQVTEVHEAGAWRSLSDLAGEDPAAAQAEYKRLAAAELHQIDRFAADVWTAAFFWPLARGAPSPPTDADLRRAQEEGPRGLEPAQATAVARLAGRHRFFHWHLEFPEVFGLDGEEDRREAGFDVVLGNPPWERIKLQEKEFFGNRSEPAAQAIAAARTASERRKLIARLPHSDPDLAVAYASALRRAESESHFIRNSGRFPLGGVGDVNTYAVFTELDRNLIGPGGRAGLIVPTGLATDFTYREFFADLMARGQIASLYDFENRRKLFADVDSRMKFSLLTLRALAPDQAEPPQFAFFLHSVDDFGDPERQFRLSAADLALINPNTRTLPVFRTRGDAELTRKLYAAAPVLVNEATGENPWGVSFAAMFHMAGDSGLFHTGAQLEAASFEPVGNRFVREKDVYLPLYEAKMIHQFDHRYASYDGEDVRDLTSQEHEDLNCSPYPRYWVAWEEVNARIDEQAGWLLAFRDITNTTNERTGIFAFIPWTAVGHTQPLFLWDNKKPFCLLANLNSIPLDYVIRQKMGGTHLSYFYLKQLPILPPARYTSSLLDFIVPRVVELSYTAWDLQAFAASVLAEAGAETWERWFPHNPLPASGIPQPFRWQEQRRAELRADLDALYAHLYGLDAAELAYILDTFPIVRRKDEARWGEYRTKRMVMERFEDLASKVSSRI